MSHCLEQFFCKHVLSPTKASREYATCIFRKSVHVVYDRSGETLFLDKGTLCTPTELGWNSDVLSFFLNFYLFLKEREIREEGQKERGTEDPKQAPH